jgi:PAS domain S-box-containing protein
MLLFLFFLNTKNSQIDFSDKEVKGLRYLYPLGLMAFQTVDLLLSRSTENNSELTASLGAFKIVDQDLRSEVGTDDSSLFIRGREHIAPQILITLMEQISVKPEPSELLKALVHILELIHHVGDTSNLILDPELDTYYLMDLTVLSIPRAVAFLLGTGILGDYKTATDWTNRLGFSALLQYEVIPALQTKSASALREDANFNGINPSLGGRLTGTLQRLIGKLQELNSGLQANQSPEELHRALIVSMEHLNTFWKVSHGELTTLLEIRMGNLESFRQMALLVVILLWSCSVILTIYSVNMVKRIQKNNDINSKQILEMSMRREMALHGAIDAIISVDESGAILEFNPAAEAIFGLAKVSVIGKSLEQVIIPDTHRVAHQKAFQKYLSDRRTDRISKRLRLPGKHVSGREFPMELSLIAIHLPNGGKIFTAFIRDLSEQYRLEHEAKVQQSKLITASRLTSLGEMAAGIAHEVKNPLAIIDGYLQQLGGLIDHPEAAKVVPKTIEAMRRSVSRISKIIDGLRAFARAGDSDPFEKIPAQKLVRDCLDLCKPRMDASGIRLTVHLNSNQSIYCRSVQISQVLVNLINNSYDAIVMTEDPWIEISLNDEGTQCNIAITDSGPGIPPHIAEKMLQPFFTTKPIGKGTGLGLSISLGIIESHRGSLTLDSKNPHTRFVIQLPSASTQILKNAA